MSDDDIHFFAQQVRLTKACQSINDVFVWWRCWRSP